MVGYDPIMAFNATEDVPEEDYYPIQRKKEPRIIQQIH